MTPFRGTVPCAGMPSLRGTGLEPLPHFARPVLGCSCCEHAARLVLAVGLAEGHAAHVGAPLAAHAALRQALHQALEEHAGRLVGRGRAQGDLQEHALGAAVGLEQVPARQEVGLRQGSCLFCCRALVRDERASMHACRSTPDTTDACNDVAAMWQGRQHNRSKTEPARHACVAAATHAYSRRRTCMTEK